jgi:beta-catenin-like protein 1
MIQEGNDVGPEMEDLWYLRRLEGGLFTLQTVDYILGWICMEDDGVRTASSYMLMLDLPLDS